MKFGLFLALLVLLAATDVFGQQRTKTKGQRTRPTGDERIVTTDSKQTTDRVRDDVNDDDRKTLVKVTKDEDGEISVRPSKGTDLEISVQKNKDEDRETSVKLDQDNKRRPEKQTDMKSEARENNEKLSGKGHQAANDIVEDERHRLGDRLNDSDKEHKDNEGDDRKHSGDRLNESNKEHKDNEGDDRKHSGDRFNESNKKNKDKKDDVIEPIRTPAKSVQVHGNIVLAKYRPSIVDAVQYDLDGSHTFGGSNERESRPFSPFARDFLARGSRVTLFVSTSKTTDPKLAFAQFPIAYKADNFPLHFDLEISLPDKQRGLLERADITLYFFVYITDADRRLDTFLPAGTSQIILQGTNRNMRALDVYVRANGIELNGLFRGRFSQRFIQPGTVFQILVVDEDTLRQKSISSVDAVGQLTISNVPAMFPVPFSFIVHYQMLKPKTRYYAVAYIFENGVRRLLNQKPVWIINEEKMAVTTQLQFTVIPSPFILRGTVTRSMPGSFIVQPGSSIVLTLHAINTDEPDIVFRVPRINTFPQHFAINVSQSSRFDPSKNYELSAQITDKNNDIYMISLQSIQITEDIENIILPVDDFLHYINVRLQSSTNQELNFIPGSNVQILLTDTPESPSKPIVSMSIERIGHDFRDFTFKIPTTGIQRNRNYYLVMMIEINGIITHVSKILLISNNQPPPLTIQLPVLSLNLIRGVINDVDQRRAQWSSSSYAKLYLLDDTVSDLEQAIVQSWTIHLENDFPIRFEVQLDFSRLQFGRTYRLQSSIENGRNVIEYKPANSAIAVDQKTGIRTDVRVFVRNVKVFQTVRGLIHIQGVRGRLPEKSEIVIQLSSTPSLTNPKIIDESRIKVDNRTLPIDFLLELPINKIDVNAIYYFLVHYTVRDSVVIPVTQAFAFAPRNQATVVITLSKAPQISITGQVTSTGSSLDLPRGAVLHLFITNNLNEERPFIISEVFLQSTPNTLYEFRMFVDSLILNSKNPLYLRGEVIYNDAVILRMPKPALLQLTPASEWNINLVIDLPTLVLGEIVSVSSFVKVQGEFDVYLQVIDANSKRVVQTIRLRLGANLPQQFRIEIDNSLFVRYSELKLRALIKNCKEEVLYESANEIDIRLGLNLNTKLTVTVNDIKKLAALQPIVDESASYYAGKWRSSITGTVNQAANGELISID